VTGTQRGGRHLDHDARHGQPRFVGGFREGPCLIRRGDHGGHHLHARPGAALRLRQGGDLVPQQVGAFLHQAVAPAAQSWVGFRPQIRERKWFVGPGIEGAYRDGPGPERRQYRLVQVRLLRHAGRVLGVQEHELGAEQPHPFGGRERRGPGVVDVAYVGQQRHRVPVGGAARRGQFVELRQAFAPGP